MDRYLSLIFLYNKASYKKIILAAFAVPIGFMAIFLIKIGNPFEANPFMLIETAFGGVCRFCCLQLQFLLCLQL